jgi:hypothetical protein
LTKSSSPTSRQTKTPSAFDPAFPSVHEKRIPNREIPNPLPILHIF